MNVNISRDGPEHPMLVPIGFPYTQLIPCAVQLRQVGVFVGGIRNHNQNVYDRLGT